METDSVRKPRINDEEEETKEDQAAEDDSHRNGMIAKHSATGAASPDLI
jgi:hypothetical protein